MNTTMRKWMAGGAVLTLAVCGATSLVRGDDDEDKKKAMEAAKAVIMKNLDAPGNGGFEAAAAKLAKEHKIEPTMNLFKPKSRGGISIGDLAKAGHKDSIELLIRDYAIIKPPTKKEVTDSNADLVKAAQVTRIIAEMTPYWGPAKAGPGGKTPEKWKSLSEDMRKSAADFVAAAKAKDEKAVKAAAMKLNNTCSECHKVFRDEK